MPLVDLSWEKAWKFGGNRGRVAVNEFRFCSVGCSSPLSLGPSPPPAPSSVCSSSSWNSSPAAAVERIIYVPTGKVSSASCDYYFDFLITFQFSPYMTYDFAFIRFDRSFFNLDFFRPGAGWLPYRPLRAHHLGFREDHRRQDRHPEAQFIRFRDASGHFWLRGGGQTRSQASWKATKNLTVFQYTSCPF